MTNNNYKKTHVQIPKESKNVNHNLDESQLDTNGNSQTNEQKDDDFETNKSSAVNQKIKIHLVGGEKGGSGKSFFSKAFIEYCELINLNLMIIDADKSNADIFKLYCNHKIVEQAFFSDDDKRMKEADIIFESALSGNNVLVNLPAQVFHKLISWIQGSDLIQVAFENNIQFIKWFVCNGGVQSADFFIQSINKLNVPHVFVKNLGLCKKWDFIEDMPNFIQAKNKYKFLSMDFPEFPYWERNRIDQLNITFNQALSPASELSLISQSRVKKSFIKPVNLAFENTKLIP